MLKNCIYCGAAEDTAKLWKVKCSKKRHKFVERFKINEGIFGIEKLPEKIILINNANS